MVVVVVVSSKTRLVCDGEQMHNAIGTSSARVQHRDCILQGVPRTGSGLRLGLELELARARVGFGQG